MTTRQQDLDRLGHAIKDAEARLRVFSQTLDTVDKELHDLGLVHTALEENVNFLKTKHIVALATEYRKAKQDLVRTKDRMVKVRIDRENILRAAKDIEDYLHKSKTEYATVFKGTNNVLAFRRKNAKE